MRRGPCLQNSKKARSFESRSRVRAFWASSTVRCFLALQLPAAGFRAEAGRLVRRFQSGEARNKVLGRHRTVRLQGEMIDERATVAIPQGLALKTLKHFSPRHLESTLLERYTSVRSWVRQVQPVFRPQATSGTQRAFCAKFAAKRYKGQSRMSQK